MSKENKAELFSCTKPCGNCPYRTDAPKQLWAKEEFEDLLASERDYFGKVYNCHKNNGSVCVGWLIDQDKRNFPSIALRISLINHGVSREYLDNLASPAPLYFSVEEMIENNFPEILL
jgi:hypothetical protein